LLKENSDETDVTSISREDDVIVEKKLKKIDKGQLAYDFYIVNINGSTLYCITIVSFVLDLNA
jgi:hypothetical protein